MGEESAKKVGIEQRRGYLPIFWRCVRWLYEMQAVSDVRLCADIGIDRKSLRKRRDDEGWQRRPIYKRYGFYIHDGETPERLQARYAWGVSKALVLKRGELTDEELRSVAIPYTVADYARAEARRHG
jgi:hypothetical protein